MGKYEEALTSGGLFFLVIIAVFVYVICSTIYEKFIAKFECMAIINRAKNVYDYHTHYVVIKDYNEEEFEQLKSNGETVERFTSHEKAVKKFKTTNYAASYGVSDQYKK
ncbi:hypothetical protein J2S09_004083 [Bacillus fengqiuensis]|nr:hypothetical protein [Bacillus fengqiuensis]